MGELPLDQIALGGRKVPFHVGEAAREIGGLGEALILSGPIGAKAQTPGYAEAIYAALCNTTWRSRHGEVWAATWRAAGDIAAAIRGWDGDDYLTFYNGGGEGRVDDDVRSEFARLGWKDTPNA